jgi:hypothetical protein
MSSSVTYVSTSGVVDRHATSAKLAALAEPVCIQNESDAIAAKLRANGLLCFRALGASMFPWIRSGDLVVVRCYEYERAAKGDVILFQRGGRLFLHRVIRCAVISDGPAGALENCLLVTKGDALDREDAPVRPSEFLGRVVRIHRGSRHIDLLSPRRIALGRALASFSRVSFRFYRPARAIKHILLG